MVRKILAGLLLLASFYSCNNEKNEKPATALDTGRAFIRASLDGNFDAAEQLILRDSQNIQLFDSYKMYYGRLSDEKKKNYRSASYEINKYLEADDSTTIINYSNSYMHKPMEIKVVWQNKTWQIDFKYTYSGNLPID